MQIFQATGGNPLPWMTPVLQSQDQVTASYMQDVQSSGLPNCKQSLHYRAVRKSTLAYHIP